MLPRGLDLAIVQGMHPPVRCECGSHRTVRAAFCHLADLGTRLARRASLPSYDLRVRDRDAVRAVWELSESPTGVHPSLSIELVRPRLPEIVRVLLDRREDLRAVERSPELGIEQRAKAGDV